MTVVNSKILIFIDWYKPGFKAGGPIRSISNIVDHLNEFYDFYIVTRDTDYLETIPYTTILKNSWNKIDNASVYYLSNTNCTANKISKLIQEINPQLVYCNSLYSYFFTLVPIFYANKYKIKTVLAVRGMLSQGSLAVKSKKKKFFLTFFKFINYFNDVIFHATTLDEKQAIENTFGKYIKIHIAENLPQTKKGSFLKKLKIENELKIISVARIAPEKNTLFAIEILKNCKEKIQFDIYGPIYNQIYWDDCLKAISNVPDNIKIQYNGILNHNDLEKTLNDYHCLLLPSTGENYGHIILEAMQYSCVPIISDRTPWRNLEIQKIGFDISLDDTLIFSEKIDLLAKMNNEEFQIWSKNSYQLGSNKSSCENLIRDYKKLFSN